MPTATIIIPLIIIGGLLLGFFPRWHERRTAISDMNQLAIPTVSVVSLTPLKSVDGLILPAEIRPWREASIYARANGYLKDWVADIGAHIRAGQLLAEIETPDLDEQLDQAKAQLVLAQANLHLAETTDARWQTLLKTASVSEQEAAEKAAGRETAAASVEAARADVRRLQELVSFQRVIAPFDGTVTRRETDIGDLIVAGSGGQELFHMAQTGKLRVYVHVPEPYALDVAPGQTATLTTPESPGLVFEAKVITTSESIATASRTLLTELEVDNSKNQILPYSYGEINFRPNRANPPLTLPSNVLIFRSQGLQVGVVRPDGTVELRSVKVGRDFGQNIEILGGLTPADRVIANPTDSLVDGVKVRIQEAAKPVAAN
ncbi:MAG TPA: efflux RND transporter periplasmic adaptor subunit [Candidatus Baltobacteraceae bacterium]|jgi:RND family efflux transporter MFP subunit|nr:efflux RND transporter periplasmic adaptor subunit [Candidatus Baltobacteraceae bacterium]